MSDAHILVLCTVPDEASAKKIAGDLITKRLAACVNMLPGLTSVYPWKGQIETSDELLLFIKSRRDRYPELEIAITENHPYELPEIISVPIAQGLAAYLNWIDQNLNLQ